jgi:ATP-dependent helicase/nuclease subunit B
MTDEDIAAARQRELKRKGLVLSDPEVLDAMEHTNGSYQYLPVGSAGATKADYLVTAQQLDALDDYLNRALEGVADQLAQGNIDADPYWHDGDKNACRYCDYAAACHFEESCGDKVRWRRALSAAEFWETLSRKEENGHGH